MRYTFRRLFRGTLFACLACFPIMSMAGSSSSTIERILVFEGGMLVYVYPTGGVLNPPACHGSNGNYFSFSMNRPMAKEYLAMLMAAHARGAVVTIWGRSFCHDQPYSETLDYLRVEN